MAEKVKKSKKKSKARENLEIVLWAILIALVIRIFFIEAYKIPTQSLYPNFLVNDHLLVNKVSHGVKLPVVGLKLHAISQPDKGDIVVFQNPLYKSPGKHLEFLDLVTFSIFSLDQSRNNPKNFIKRCMGTPGDVIDWESGNKISINDKVLKQSGHEILDYSKVDYGAMVGPYKVYDTYMETNKNKTYKVQYVKGRVSSERKNMLYYIPKKGDKLVIKRKNNTSNKFIVTISDIDITHLWLGNESKRVRGYNEMFSEESSIDFTNQNFLLTETKDGKVFEYTVRENYYFMIGDNRDNSEDGRYFGPVRENLIIGSPLFRYFPFNRIGGC